MLEQIDQDQFKNLKRLGVRNGQEHFQVKTPNQAPASRISKLTLNALKQAIKQTTARPKNHKNAELSLIRRMQKRSVPAKKILKEHNIAHHNPETYKRASFNIDFIPPKGVSEDELNSMEKMFYGFQKRTYLTYFNSFIKNYGQLSKKRPKLEKSIRTEDHLLTGRITYDKYGHIVTIKILKWSSNDDIQELFEETLKKLKLPNPPKALIKEKEFNIYFQLVFNDARN